jgi:hypothetical protein
MAAPKLGVEKMGDLDNRFGSLGNGRFLSASRLNAVKR